MIFYKIKFNSFPKIKFASSVRTDRYKNIITHRKNMIELSINSGAVEIEENNNKYFAPANSFQLVTPDMDIKTHALDCQYHYTSSAAIEGDFEVERIESSDINEIKRLIGMSKEDIILPSLMELGGDYTEVERLFKSLIIYYLKDSPSGRMCVIAKWCEIAAWIDNEFRRRIFGEKEEKTVEYYSRKAQKYIETHYKDKIEVNKIAKLLNISPNYLSNIFRKSTGKTVTEFIAETRIYHARRLAYNGDMSFEKIASEVGICNEKYLNKLFKKYFGTSIKKCVMTDHEISLYHDKPWEVENLTKDIFE